MLAVTEFNDRHGRGLGTNSMTYLQLVPRWQISVSHSRKA
jgi:hypothetical protein